MKKGILALTMILGLYSAQAQLTVSTAKFDLESIGKESWSPYGGYKSANGDLVLKLGKAACDMTQSSGTATFNGVEWDFEELHFDGNMNYLSSTSKHFDNTTEVMAYEQVWGKSFGAFPVGWTGGDLRVRFSPDYLGKKTVLATRNMFGKLAMSSVVVHSKVTGALNSKGTAAVGCSESPHYTVQSSSSPVEEKGQKWMPVKGFHKIGGADVLFQVAGIAGIDDTKMNYVINRYDESLKTTKTLNISFDYNNSPMFLEATGKNGEKDYVIISQTSDKYAPKGCAIKPANYAEIIVVDGNNLEVRTREAVELPYSKWLVNQVVYSADGSMFIMGATGANKTDYISMPGAGLMFMDGALKGYFGNNPDDLPNYQIIKLTGNKIASVNAVSAKEALPLVSIVEGSPFKAKPMAIFTSALDNLQRISSATQVDQDNLKVYFANGKMLVCFETFVSRKAYDTETNGWATMIFDANGKLEKYLILPTSGFAKSDQVFSAQGNSMYWIYYETNTLNKVLSGNGSYTPNAVNGLIAGTLMIAKVNLDSNSAGSIQTIGKDEFAVNAVRPLIADLDGEMVFQGKTLSKKAKESELVMIKVGK